VAAAAQPLIYSRTNAMARSFPIVSLTSTSNLAQEFWINPHRRPRISLLK
jgi:hypothetical protein